jgi:hypothetical protein
MALQDRLLALINAIGADIKSLQASLTAISAASGATGLGGVSAFLTATQANSTVTPAVLTGHTFTLLPGKVLQLSGQVICTSAATTTGFAVGIRVANAAAADANAIGSCMIEVDLTSAAAATSLTDGDVFNVGANANALVEVLGTATVAGNNAAKYQATIKNQSTNKNVTVTVEFRSEVATSAVTAQIGTGCVGVII